VHKNTFSIGCGTFSFAVKEVTLKMASHCSMYLSGRNAGREVKMMTDV
jgi:hypothetical protein